MLQYVNRLAFIFGVKLGYLAKKLQILVAGNVVLW